MTELMKKYIETAEKERKNNELYRQFNNERRQKVLFIKDNEDLFGQVLKSELVDKVFEFYDNNEQFKTAQKNRERISHELSILWEVATDDEKKKIDEYFINRIHELIDKRRT